MSGLVLRNFFKGIMRLSFKEYPPPSSRTLSFGLLNLNSCTFKLSLFRAFFCAIEIIVEKGISPYQ